MLFPKVLQSSRIQLRKAHAGDSDILFTEYFGSIEASRFLSRLPHPSVEHTDKFLSQWCDEAWGNQGQPFAWVIADLDNKPLGILLVFLKNHIAEIHYGVSPKYSGNGYATEAVQMVSDWLLDHASIKRVWTAVDTEHLATQKILERTGFQSEGVLRSWAVLPAFGSNARDAIAYSKVRSV